jgi:hypothetical protein
MDVRITEDEHQRQLRDLLCLAVVGDHVRWVLTGDRSAQLADWLAEAGANWRAWADRVAKELAGSGVAPDARVRSLAQDIPLNWVPDGWLETEAARSLVADRLGTLAEWAHYRRLQSTGARRETLDVICSGFDAQLLALRDMAVTLAG